MALFAFFFFGCGAGVIVLGGLSPEEDLSSSSFMVLGASCSTLEVLPSSSVEVLPSSIVELLPSSSSSFMSDILLAATNREFNDDREGRVKLACDTDRE